MNKKEFLSRYYEYPNRRIELVNGEVLQYPIEPIDNPIYSSFIDWGMDYVLDKPLRFCFKPLIEVDDYNVLCADVLILIKEEMEVSEDGLLKSPPNLVVEIALDDPTFKLTTKKELYFKSKCGEYIVFDAKNVALYWWWRDRESGEYKENQPIKTGLYKSVYFPDLYLDLKVLSRVVAQANKRASTPSNV